LAPRRNKKLAQEWHRCCPLTPDTGEVDDLDLRHEAQYCNENGMRFDVFPIIDRSVPSSDAETLELLDRLDGDLDSGKNVVVHCRQGIGRAALITTSLLMARGLSPSDAIERVSAARQAQAPETAEQRAWLAQFYAFK